MEAITSTNKNHYTYLLQSKTDDMMYIGVRSCECQPEDDNYWGSSKNLPKGKYKNLSDLCDKFILGKFDTREDAIKDEIKRHKANDVARNPNFWNKSLQTATGFDRSGTEYPVAWNKGKVTSNEVKAKISKANKGSKRTQAVKDKMGAIRRGAKHTEASKLKMSNTHKSIQHYSFGKGFSDEHKANMSKAQTGKKRPQTQVTCPHCSKTSGIPTMTRWHFDNCKENKKCLK